MAMQMGALRDALLDAGATVDMANKAAEEVANYEQDMARLRSDVRLLTWMVGGVYPLLLGILVKLLAT